MINRDQINNHYEFIIAREKMSFTKHGKLEMARAYSIDSSGNIQIIGLPFENPEQKNAAAAYLRASAKRLDTQAYIFVSEIWFQGLAFDSEEELEEIRKIKSIEHHPHSVDALMINLETKYESRLRVWIVHRDRRQRVTLTEFDIPKGGGGFEGRFSNLLRDGIPHNTNSTSNIDGEGDL